MVTHDADDLVPFQDVKVLRSTVPALLCRIGERTIWLSRRHISGKLWSTGDRGKLFIRRWVARDQNLIEAQGAVIRPPLASLAQLPAGLHLVRDRTTTHAK